MSVALVQTKSQSSTTNYVNTIAVPFTSNVGAGNFLIATISTSAAAIGTNSPITSIGDTLSSGWSRGPENYNATDGQRTVSMWYAPNTGSGANTVTINFDGYYEVNVTIQEYSGVNTTAVLDRSASYTEGTSYANAHTAGPTGVTTVATELLITAYTSATPAEVYSAGAGTTNIYNSQGAENHSLVTGNAFPITTGAKSMTINSADYVLGAGVIAAFKAGVAAPVTAPPGANNTPDWYPYGVLPTGKSVASLQGIAQNWWTNHVKPYIVTTGMPSGLTGAMRVQRPENSNDTVSEGMGYALIGAVQMDGYDTNAHTIFDSLFKYVKYYFNSNGLMSYRINSDGSIFDTGAATDADYDIAWALHLAALRWGNGGTYNYTTERNNYLAAILAKEHYPTAATGGLANVMIDGDAFDTGFTGSPNLFDPDYFSPMYMQAWSTLNSRWSAIKAANYPIYYSTDNYNTGLIPDHQKRDGTASTTSGLTGYNNTYNAVRRFRQVADYLNFGSTLGTPYEDYYQHAKLGDFIATQSSNAPASFKGEWTIDGTSNAGYTNSTFASSYMVAMLVNSSHAQLAADSIDWIVAHPDGSYFGDMVAFMGLMTAAGYMTAGPTLNTDYFNVSSTVVTTKNQTSNARIQKTLAATRPAVARISKTISTTQPANARITKTVTKTQAAVARISASYTKTQTSVARIAKNSALTQPAIARISKTFVATQSANARIAKQLNRTQSAIARIVILTGYLATQTAVARILKTNANTTQTANSRVAKSFTRTQTSVARIAKTFTTTQAAVSRIQQVGPIRYNYIQNPSAETGISGWNTYGGNPVSTLSQDNTHVMFGSQALKITASTTADGQGFYAGANMGTATQLISGQNYTFSTYVWSPVTTTGNQFNLYVSSGATNANNNTDLVAGWNRISITFLAQSAGAICYIRFRGAASAIYWVDGVQVESGMVPSPYFDGSLPGGSWTGTANASVSAISGYQQTAVARIAANRVGGVQSVQFTTGSSITMNGNPAIGNLATTQTGAFTLRYKLSTSETITNRQIFSMGVNRLDFNLETGSNKLFVYAYYADSSQGVVWKSATNNVDGLVHQLIVNKTATTIDVYIDGAQVASQATTQLLHDNSGVFSIGSANIEVSNVAVWSRSLTSSELTNLSQEILPSSGLLTALPLNEGYGSTPVDTTANYTPHFNGTGNSYANDGQTALARIAKSYTATRPAIARVAKANTTTQGAVARIAGLAIVQLGSGKNTVGANNATANYPNTPPNGDLLLAFIGGYSGLQPLTPPTGWALLTSSSNSTAFEAVYYKVASAETNSYTWSSSNTDYFSIALYDIVGQNTQQPINGYASSTGSTDPSTTASVTPNVNGTLAIAGLSTDSSGRTDSVTTSGWVLDQSVKPPFHQNDVAHRSALTTDTTTAQNVTFSGNGTSVNASIILLVAPVGTNKQNANARIAKTYTKTQPTVARISKSFNYSQTSIARLQAALSKTQGALANIVVLAARNASQTAIARVSKTISKTQPGLARIAKVFTNNQSANARIAKQFTYGINYPTFTPTTNSGIAFTTNTGLASATPTTVTMWVKPSALPASEQKFMSARNRMTLGWETSGAFRFEGNGAGGYKDTTATYTPNIWYHIAIVNYDTNLIGYVNAVSQVTVTGLTATGWPSSWSIGSDGGNNRLFAGAIRDVRIFNRDLTQTEINTVRSGGNPTDAATSLVSWYLLNNGSGATAYDIAGSNPGSMLGYAWTTDPYQAIARIAVTRTLTQSAVARLINNVTRTQPATSRVSKSFTATQSANGRFTAVIAKTEPANGRITKTITTSQPAIARVSKVFVNSEPAVARIAKVFTNLQAAISRLSKLFTFTQSANARVSKTLTKTQTSVARVAKTITKTQAASAYMLNPYAFTQLATARIQKALTKTQSASAYMVIAKTLNQPATARVSKSITKTQTAISRVQKTFSATQSAVSRMAKAVILNQPATARISKSTTKTQSAIGRIQKSFVATQSAISRVAVVGTKTQAAIARIAPVIFKTQAANSRVQTTRNGGQQFAQFGTGSYARPTVQQPLGSPYTYPTVAFTFLYKFSAPENSANRQIYSPGSNRLDVNIETGSQKLFVWFTDSANNGHLVWKSPVANNDGQIHQILVNKTSTSVDVWLDNVLVGNYATTLSSYNNTSTMSLGNAVIEMADTAAWNRSLTSAEINNVFAGNYVTSGMAYYWPMNDGYGTNLSDASGQNITGQLLAGSTFSNDGQLANARVASIVTKTQAANSRTQVTRTGPSVMQFVSGAYVDYSNQISNLLLGSTSHPMTLFVDFYAPNALATDGYLAVSVGQFLMRLGTANNLTSAVWNINTPYSTTIMTRADWHRVGFTFDGTSTVLQYIDGVQDGTATGSPSTGSTGNTFQMGARNNGNYFIGTMRNLKIWNRALSAAEVTSYTNGAAVTSGLVLNAPFNEGYGTSAVDISGNSYNGTLTGSTPPTYTPQPQQAKARIAKTFTNNITGISRIAVVGLKYQTAKARIQANGRSGNISPNPGFESHPASVNGSYTTFSSYVVSGNGNDISNADATSLAAYRWMTNTYNTTAPLGATYDTTVYHSGGASMKMVGTDVKERVNITLGKRIYGDLNDPVDIQQNLVPVSPNTAYRFGFWYKMNVTGVTGTPESTSSMISIIEHTPTGYTGKSDTYYRPATITQDWTYAEINFITGGTTQYVNIWGGMTGNGTNYWSGTLWFDDLNLQSTGNPQNAIGRIQKSFSSFQYSNARISKSFAKTQSANARIANSYTKTQPSLARIAKTFTKMQTAISRVANSYVKTQPGVARIATVGLKYQTATARIRVIGNGTAFADEFTDLTNYTQVASWGVQNNAAYTLTNGGSGWNSSVLLSTQTYTDFDMVVKVKKGSANDQVIFRSGSTSGSGYGVQLRSTDASNNFRLENWNSSNIVQDSSIPAFVTGNYYWVHIRAMASHIQARLWADGSAEPTTWNIDVINTLFSSGGIGFSTEANLDAQYSNLKVYAQVTFPQVATVRIQKNFIKSQTGTARISKSFTTTQTAKARISKSFTNNQSALARIGLPTSKTQAANARIAKAFTKTQTGTVRISKSFTKTQTSVARIQKSVNRTQTAKARIQEVVYTTRTAKARIQITVSKQQTARAYIVANVVEYANIILRDATNVVVTLRPEQNAEIILLEYQEITVVAK